MPSSEPDPSSTHPTRAAAAAAPRLAFAVVTYNATGGMQRALARIGAECAARGALVDLYAARLEADPPAGIYPQPLPVRALTNHGRNIRFGARFAEAARTGGYDCVVGFNRLPGLDFYYAADPCFAAQATLRPFWHRLTHRYRAYLTAERSVFQPASATEILLVAHDQQAQFQRHYHTPAARFHRLPPGLDRSHLRATVHPTAIRAELKAGPHDRVLLTVATHFKTKGVDRVLRALATLPAELRTRIRYAVVGGDNPRPYRRLARRLGLAGAVVFLGPRDDLGDIYRAADLLIHPARTENTGNVLLEAMACGLPVLTTANCGYAAHVQAANAGRVCPAPFAPAEFAQALGLALDRGTLNAWRANGPRYCAGADVYDLVPRAADRILARARRNAARRNAAP